MLPISKELINEIAELLDCGFRCFINKTNAELISIPNELNHSYIETDTWSKEIQILKDNNLEYFEIEPLESRDYFLIMEDFLDTLPSNKIKNKLKNALENKKPFKNFKFIIDNSDEYRNAWFEFKKQKLQEWVVEKYNNFYRIE
ncbi:MAG: UPF0158 family protein [Flavobacterium sp.]